MGLFAPVNMTKGNPVAQVVRFTLPMLLGNIAQQLYNTVDSIIVGRYVGDRALAAVGSAGPLLNIMIVLFMEQAVLSLMNRLIGDPTLIQCSKQEELPSAEASQLKTRLYEYLSDQPVNESDALPLIFRLAAAQYAAIGDGDYETQRLRSIFSQVVQMGTLDAGLLKDTVSSIREAHNGTIEITLKNGQIIEGRDVS